MPVSQHTAEHSTMLGKWFSTSKKDRVFRFRCTDCDELHEGSPSFGYRRPPAVFAIPEDERDERVRANDDFCQIDDDAFFIRTVLEIPIHDVDEPFMWGVWVSQSEENFLRYIETFEGDQSDDGSFGWLEVTMPGYATGDDPLQSLACDVQWESDQRPRVHIHECDHPLYLDQVSGISWDRAAELGRHAMHASG